MFIKGEILSGYIGGNYEDCGLFEHKIDAERGIMAEEKLYEIFSKYDCKKVKITIEVIEE